MSDVAGREKVEKHRQITDMVMHVVVQSTVHIAML